MAPLRIASLLGCFMSVTSVLYMIYVVVKTLLFGDEVKGYPSMIAITLFIGGVQLLILGIIGEYLGRIFNESKRRPVYLIKKIDGKLIIRQDSLQNH